MRRVVRGVVFTRRLRIGTWSSEVSDVTPREVALGIYEGAEMRLLNDHLSAAAARRSGSRVRMICAAANPELLVLAERNVRGNAPLADLTVPWRC